MARTEREPEKLVGKIDAGIGAGLDAGVDVRIDWPQFLARHDLVWEELPRRWREGAFIGNGLLGSMIYAGEGCALGWDVGRSDVVDRGGRIAVGRFVLVPRGKPQGGTIRLDLWNAEARGTLRTDRGEIEWRSFTHAEDMVTLVELRTTPGERGCRLEYRGEPALPARKVYGKEPVPEKERNPAAETGASGGTHFCRQEFKAGGGYVVAWREEAPAADRRVVAFTVDFTKTGRPETPGAVALVKRSLGKGLDGLVSGHRAWWHAYWPQSFVSIPDTRMESFWWIQMYKLASATRADRTAIDLMGPWFRTTPWAAIWWNLNIQLTYWPVYAANRLELGESLTRMIDEGRRNLIGNVPGEFRADSAAIGRTSSYDCRGGWLAEKGDLTWALHNYWLQYRYSGDEAMLRDRLFPILKRAVNYYLHILEEGDDGRLHTPVAISPEYPKQAPDTNYDLALLRWGLETLVAANERLRLADALEPKWRETLSRLAPYPVDPETGYMVGRGVPFAQSHRHFSHLLMVYPLHLVDPESAADRPLIERSLDHWIGFKGALQGYSYTGSAAMSAWLGRRDDAVRLVDEFLDLYVKPNTMYLEAGPVIETPLSGAATINEILLQSWCQDTFGTYVRVFPAVPDSWPDVTMHEMRAEGAFLVSASRRGGETKFVQLTSLAGAPCRVRTGLREPVVASGERDFQVTVQTDHNGNRVTVVDLKMGETVLLTSGASPPSREDLVMEPVAAQPDRLNVYGSAKAPPIPQAPDGAFDLHARKARLHGDEIFYEKTGTKDNIGHWVSAGDWAAWRLVVKRPGRFRVIVTYATPGGGSRFSVGVERKEAGGARVKGAAVSAGRVSTGAWDAFRDFEIGTLEIERASLSREGECELAVRSADGKAPYLNLKRVRLVWLGEH